MEHCFLSLEPFILATATGRQGTTTTFLRGTFVELRDGIALTDGDWINIRYEGFGLALRNPIRVEAKTTNRAVMVRSLA